jgi:lipopolysaccharide transport system ATP-binding protein
VSRVIKVESVSKKYIIGHQQLERYLTLRDMTAQKFKAVGKRLLHPFVSSSGEPLTGLSTTEELWALKDSSFEIKQGERVGIIGRNGAGKSTLLKILSRITEPTTGRIRIKGRVASLLEVGTGFHPELTGRENIFLNGAVLGMSKVEIKRKFDEIVDFAGVEKFLDTPVKRYSSGMYVRLAFAVAAHLEPEILVVDEVLAVGDAQFQKKCLGKMGDFAKEGRTVLFVSHNMAAITSLCDRGILLDEGAIVKDGPAPEVVQAYLNRGRLTSSKKVWAENERPGNQWFRLISVSLKNSVGVPAKEVKISEEATIEIEYEVLEEGARAQFSVVLYDANGYCVLGSLSNTEENFHGKGLKPGRYMSVCSLYGNLLNNGRYHVSIIGASAYWNDSFRADHVISFDALDDGVLKGDYPGSYGGVVRPKLSWKTVPLVTDK